MPCAWNLDLSMHGISSLTMLLKLLNKFLSTLLEFNDGSCQMLQKHVRAMIASSKIGIWVDWASS